MWKKLQHIFSRIIDINDKFNVCSTISYYNVKHIKATIMTPYCRTTFRLLAHVSLLQYCRSSNMLSFRKNLAHISAWYPSISSWWTQWVKNNNRPNYSQELKRVLAWPSSHYSNYPCSFFFLHGESCSSWSRGKFNSFLFYLSIFYLYKSKRCMC